MTAPLNIDLQQILLHLLNLVILVGGLTLILYKPVTRFLKNRQDYFASKEREISEKEQALDALKAEYEEKLKSAREEIDRQRLEAKQELAKNANNYMEQAKAKADALIKDAEQEAEVRKEHILESAQTEIGELVLSAAQKLLADTETPQRDSVLYDEFIKLAQTSAKDKDQRDE